MCFPGEAMFAFNSQHLDNLLQQLPSPYILLGDFNGHNILLGGQNNASRGELIENFITKNDICIMNDTSYTYHSPSTHPPCSPTREHFDGVGFRPPVLGLHRSYTCTNKICAIDPLSHCLPGIIYKRKNI